MDSDVLRCEWVTNDPLYITYHDEEWGSFKNFFDDNYLFESLTLEIAQAGLSWLTILRRREAYRKLFCCFDPKEVAQFTKEDIERLCNDKRIIRNRRKIEATVENSKAIVKLQSSHGSFHSFLWDFFGRRRVINNWRTADEVPAQTKQSKELSDYLKRHGFIFVGPVLCYSFMQAVGLVDDHIANCIVRKRKVNNT
ncbi:MAG TPA: DNA-3-methyladenine glycosylase I [Pseudogracilibacillus sp.]|nr:DNA-3-methyladenine glycosylase I [Pseudogracilibacillus sp.]